MRQAHTRVVHSGAIVKAEDANEILVTICGARIGSRIQLEPEHEFTVLGRDLDAAIVVDDDSVSRQHCRLFRQGRVWYVQDLNSTNGTYVAGKPVTTAALRDGDLIKLGSTIFKFLSTANVEAAYYEEIYRMAIFDGLTQIHNRRYFEEFTEREISRALRHDRELSMLLFDIDHFKQINDRYGHLSGDHALREMAARIKDRIRREELFARYAGDEFVVLLPETEAVDAIKFGEMVRELIADHTFVFDGQELPVTISVGVGALKEGITTPAQLVKVADDALYRAKENGRNTVAI